MKHGNSQAGKIPIFRERLSELQGDRTTTEFASFLGLSRQTVGFYLNGDRIPDALTLSQIAVKCKVSSDYLLGLSDVCSADPDAQASIEYTGLSQETVSILHCLQTIDNSLYDAFQTEAEIQFRNALQKADNLQLLKFELYRLIEELISIIAEQPLLFGPAFQNARFGIINSHIPSGSRSNYEPAGEIIDELHVHGYQIIPSNRYADWQLNTIFDELKHRARINIFRHARTKYPKK